MNNYDEVSIKLYRIDICDLLLACIAAENAANDDGIKWKRLHDKLKKQLDKLDKE